MIDEDEEQRQPAKEIEAQIALRTKRVPERGSCVAPPGQGREVAETHSTTPVLKRILPFRNQAETPSPTSPVSGDNSGFDPSF